MGGGPGGPEGGGPVGVGRNADRSGSSPSGTGLALGRRTEGPLAWTGWLLRD